MAVFLTILFISLFVYFIFVKYLDSKDDVDPQNIIDQISDFNETRSFYSGGSFRMVIDDNRKKVIFVVGKEIIKADFSDIVRAEVLVDSNFVYSKSSLGTLGRIATGGMLFGSVGALAGGLSGEVSGETLIKSIKVKILLRNQPLQDIQVLYHRDIFGNGTKKAYLTDEFNLAEQLVDTITLIIDEADRIERQRMIESSAPNVQTGPSFSATDELGKLWRLKERGAITEKEYNKMKHNILGM